MTDSQAGTELSYDELYQLGVSHRDQFRRFGKLEDVEQAIRYHSHALALTPHGHPDLSRLLGNLGISYVYRFDRLGEHKDLEKAFEFNSRAVESTHTGDPELPRWLANLGVSYNNRFRRLGEFEDLEKAIECASQGVELAPNHHPNLPRWLANLGMFYTDRFQHLGEIEDLVKAMEYKSRAVESTPNGDPELPRRLANLGMSYTDCFRRTRRIGYLEKAIELLSHAVELTPNDHPDQLIYLTSLGVSYSDRFQNLGKIEDIEKAIECGSRAVESAPNDHPNLPRWLANLGVFLNSRFTHLKKLEDLVEAVENKSRAVELTPDEHPTLPFRHFQVAVSCFLYYQHTNDLSYLGKSLDSFRKASQNTTGAPRNKFQYAFHWAKLASKNSALNCMEAYQVTINLLPQFIWLGASTNQRYRDLLIAGDLAVNAASVAILSSNYTLALEWLEHARCVVWNQSLTLCSPLDELRSFHPDLATRLQEAADQLHTTSLETRPSGASSSSAMTSDQASKQRRRLAKEYHDLLVEVRQLPGFESFLQPMKASNLTRAARNGPIIVINCHTDRCDALLILPGRDDIEHISLPNFTEEKARHALSEMNKSLRQKRLRERGIKALKEPGYRDCIEKVLAALWANIIKPILDFLGYTSEDKSSSLPHITWCPTGALSFLPLHAAGDYNQPKSRIFDYVISSYTPTLNALLTTAPSSLSLSCRLLAIGQAATPGHNPLPGTVRELEYVRNHTQDKVKYSQLIDDQATKAAVLDAMEQHEWVHLACHAHQNVDNPTKSGFYLHDGTLDLAAINGRSFKKKGLAFLSACQTATGDELLPDEAIHLASGMLMAGYPSVIATMWSVVDEDAPFVADRVYAEMMKHRKVGNGEAGKALYYAVAALRERVGEQEFGRWVPYIHIGS